MTAQPTGHAMWSPDPIRQRLAAHPIHVFAYDLGKNGYALVADATEELVPRAPFDIRLPIRDITP
jgi:hypothetical protein